MQHNDEHLYELRGDRSANAMSATTPTTASNAACAFAFMAAELLAMPGLAIGMYAYTVGRVDGSSGWLSGVFELLFSGLVVLPIVLVCLIALLFAGAFASVRPWAASMLLIVNIAATIMAWTVVAPKAPSEFLVWLPTLASTAIVSWLAWREFAK
jgi:hypothetical protein